MSMLNEIPEDFFLTATDEEIDALEDYLRHIDIPIFKGVGP